MRPSAGVPLIQINVPWRRPESLSFDSHRLTAANRMRAMLQHLLRVLVFYQS